MNRFEFYSNIQKYENDKLKHSSFGDKIKGYAQDNHLYYKRIGNPGNYKYFYSKDEYDAYVKTNQANKSGTAKQGGGAAEEAEREAKKRQTWENQQDMKRYEEQKQKEAAEKKKQEERQARYEESVKAREDAEREARRPHTEHYNDWMSGKSINPYGDFEGKPMSNSYGHNNNKTPEDKALSAMEAFTYAMSGYWDVSRENIPGLAYSWADKCGGDAMWENMDLKGKDALVKQAKYSIDMYEKEYQDFLKQCETYYNETTKGWKEENKKWVEEQVELFKNCVNNAYEKAKKFVEDYEPIKTQEELYNYLYNTAKENSETFYKRMKEQYGDQYRYTVNDIMEYNYPQLMDGNYDEWYKKHSQEEAYRKNKEAAEANKKH